MKSRAVLLLFLATTIAVLSAGAPSLAAATQAPFTGDDCVAFQINPAHTGSVSTPNLAPPLQKLWTVNLGGYLSYPLIADGKVFVLSGSPTSYRFGVYALDAATGAIDWGPVTISGIYNWGAAAYDNGVVFVVTWNGLVTALNAGTGTVLWTQQPESSLASSSPPVAMDGQVYFDATGDGSDDLFALSEADGHLVWSSDINYGDYFAPAVAADGIYAASVNGQITKFDFANGNVLWESPQYDAVGGGGVPLYCNGLLYTASGPESATGAYLGALVLSAQTGQVQPTNYSGFGVTPALDSGMGFCVTNGMLVAQVLATDATVWTSQLPAGVTLVTAPVVANGVVYVGSATGSVYGYDGRSGQLLWSDSVGAPILAPNEREGPPLTGLGAGDSLLVVPASGVLVAFGSAPPTQTDCGGAAVSPFSADMDYSGGSTFTSSNAVSTSGVTNAAPAAVYRSQRYGNFSYTVPNLTAGASYTVRLHFAETWFGTSYHSGGAGSRVFNVAINGSRVLTNFDVYASAGGADKAIVEDFAATADDAGSISIAFASEINNAMIEGIEVLPASPAAPPVAPTGLTAQQQIGIEGSQVALNWTAAAGASSYRLYRGTASGAETLYAMNLPGPSYTDTQPQPGETCYYTVTAVGPGGESAFSNQASAGIPAAPVTDVLTIDAGGDAVGAYAADKDYTWGNLWSTSEPIDTSEVTDPAPMDVYRSQRYGECTYTLPGLTPGASYIGAVTE